MRFYSAILISISLHLSLFLLYHRSKEFTLPEKITFIEMEWGSPGKMGHSFKKGGNGLARTPPPLSLKDLGIGPYWQGDSKVPVGEGASSEGGEGSEGDGNILSHLKRTVPLEVLFRKLDEGIYYPKEFIDEGIEGTVSGTLYFDSLGKFMRKKSQVKSSSNYLRVLIIKCFRSALASPLPPTLRVINGLRIPYTVTFLLTRTDNSMEMSDEANHGSGNQRGIAGNTLAIYRAAKVIGQWKLGPFSGYAVVPSLGIDPNWFVDGVAKIFNGITKRRAEIDPLEIYRNSLYWRQNDQGTFGEDES